MPRSSSKASSASSDEGNTRQTSKKGDRQGGGDQGPAFLTVPDSVKDKFPDAGGAESKQEGKHQHHHHHQGSPTARKGSESGGSASKRIQQTRQHEKERSKGRPEK